MTEHHTLSILQYNVNKSKDKVMLPLFEELNTPTYDILAVQEPWRNPFQQTINNRLSQCFELSYMPHPATRVCFFIHKRLALSTWNVKHHTPDFSILEIRISNARTIRIHNIYNPCQQSGDPSLIPTIVDRLNESPSNIEHILLGDFNLHHPLWGGLGTAVDEDTEHLILLTQRTDMEQVLPCGTITWHRGNSKSTLDLVFMTPLLRNSLVKCRTSSSSDCHSYHKPIRTVINLSTTEPALQARQNWNKIDTEKLQARLAVKLQEPVTLYPPSGRTWDQTKDGIDQQIDDIIDAIQDAIEWSTPFINMSPYTRPGFTAECKEAQKVARKLKKKWQKLGTEEAWEVFREARNLKGRIIKKAMKEQYRLETEEACESPAQIWKRCKWSRDRCPKEACIPALNSHPPRTPPSHPADKAQILLDAFFPRLPDVDLTNITGVTYNPCYQTGKITAHEIRVAITGSISNKAPGEDGIPNLILKLGIEQLLPHLYRIFNDNLSLGYCPSHFRASITVVMRKPGKPNYTVPKAYRPIALLNTLGKALELILAKRITYLAETHGLLPLNHLGARRILHYIAESIYSAWNKKKTSLKLSI